MAAAKTTATLSFRIEPGLKEAHRTASELEHRTSANMAAVLFFWALTRHNYDVNLSHFRSRVQSERNHAH